MRILVTGATGFIGSAVVNDLIAGGHSVLGLARSDEGAAALAAAGADVARGELADPESLAAATAGVDAVIHAAFVHDFAKFRESCEIDRRAIEALGAALAGSGRPLIVTSGTGLLPPGQLTDETTPAPPANDVVPRVSERTALALAAGGVDARIVRLPPTVHGTGDHGFVPLLIGIAREKGVSAYLGDGGNHWPAVHRLDAARLYRLVLEKGSAGRRYHCVAEEGVPFRDIAAVIGRRLGVPVVGKPAEEAAGHFGWFAHFAALDNRASSAQTRAELGWRPVEPGLIADIDQPAYFGG